jgi:hypothetical protein
MDGLRKVDPLLIEAELLHVGLCLGLMCSLSRKVKREIRRKKIEQNHGDKKIKRTLLEES